MTGEGLRQTAEPGEQKEGSVQVAYGFVVVRRENAVDAEVDARKASPTRNCGPS
jgi:hypothetical protein